MGCEGCFLGIFLGFFVDCGFNREKVLLSIVCICLCVLFMLILDFFLFDGFEVEFIEFLCFLLWF